MAAQSGNMNEEDGYATIEEVVYKPPSSSSDEEEFDQSSNRRRVSSPRSAWEPSDQRRVLHNSSSLYNIGNEYTQDVGHSNGNKQSPTEQKPRQRPVPAPRRNLKKSTSEPAVGMEACSPPRNVHSQQPYGHHPKRSHDNDAFRGPRNQQQRYRHGQVPMKDTCSNPTEDSTQIYENIDSDFDHVDRDIRKHGWVKGHEVRGAQDDFQSQRPGSSFSEHIYMQPSEVPKAEAKENATVVVSKISPNTSAEVMQMYFENKRRSGGGEISEFEFDKGVARITFKDPEAAREVIQRSHELGGSSLTVIPGKKKKPRPKRPYDPCQLCLTDIPDGVTDEVLKLFIDGRTKKDEDCNILYGENPGTALVTYPSKIEDIDRIIQNFQKRKLKGSYVKASLVQIADSILVQNLKPGCTEQGIELYFESTKNSGGDSVREVRLLEGEKAVVFFENWEVVERVLAKSHSLESFKLQVTPFYDVLGAKISTDGPTPRVPQPEVINVDPMVADHIFNESNVELRLRQEMQTAVTQIEWPHEQDKGKIKLVPDTAGNKNPTVWKSWKQDAVGQLTSFFDHYEAREVHVETAFWNDICDNLKRRNPQSVRPILRSNEGVIILLGESNDVRSLATTITTQLETLEEAAEKERQTMTKQITFNDENLKLFLLCRIRDDVEQRWSNVKFTLNPSSNAIECKGMQGEVLNAQLEISNQLHNLSKRSIEVSPSKSHFISLTEDKIHEILNAKNIYAACNSDGPRITVTGKTDGDRDRAMQYIEQDLVEKHVPIDNESTLTVLQGTKGKDVFRKLNNRKAVFVSLNQNNSQVIVTGFGTDVKESVRTVEEFIKENVILKQVVPAEKGKLRFISEYKGEEVKVILGNNRHNSVQIQFQMEGRQSRLLVSGNQQGMALAVQALQGLIENIVHQQYPVGKPGIPQLLRENKGKRFLNSVEKDTRCIIETGQEFDFDDNNEDPGVPQRNVKVLRRHVLPGGCAVAVCKGDLTTEQVDAIVNAANVDLQHTGGVAAAIVNAGGSSIQVESKHILRQKGRSLNTSEVVQTSSGRLPCKHVLHVAGPKWESSTPKPRPGDDPTMEENLLHDAITNVLREARRLNVKTISIPAISSGIFGFPIHLCARTIVEASIEFCKKNKSCSLKEIRFTNIDDRSCNAFRAHFQQEFGADDQRDSMRSYDDESIDDFMTTGSAAGYSRSSPRPKGMGSPNSSTSLNQVGRHTITTRENKTITLKKADLATERVDVIVNTTSGNLQLNTGAVSASILARAGSQLQQECNDELAQQGLTGLGAGEILETGPARLNCQAVYHARCCSYAGAKSELIFCKLVMDVLHQASQSRMQSIAFPAIGTGNLKFPHSVAAKLMYETVIKFSQQNPTSSLVDVRFVLYHKDKPTIQAFEGEMQRLMQGGAQIGTGNDDVPRRRLKKSQEKPGASSGPSGKSSFEGLRQSRSGLLEMTLGKIRVQVCSGDLTKESTEAIVNSVGEDLDLQGPVSQAIIQEGGGSIARECQQLRDKGDAGEVIKTGAGRLNCNMIIHVVTPRNLKKLKEITGKALQLAEKEKCASIAFPALGTGRAASSGPDQAAGQLLDAIGEFAANGKPKHLLLIKLTIFQPSLMKVFQDQMRSKEGDSYSASKNFFQRGADFVKWVFSRNSAPDDTDFESAGTDVDRASDTLILHMYAGQRRDLQDAKKKIDEYIEEEFTRDEMKYESEIWGDLDGRKMDKIFGIARQNNVKIDPMLGGRAKRILMEGRKVDVNNTKAEMNRYFTEIQLEKQKELEGRLMNKEVEWRYKEPGIGQMAKYGEEINPLIERAFNEQKPYVELELEDGKIRIDFRTMKESDRSGRKTDIERVDLKKVAASGISMPQNWIPMNPGQNSQVVKMNPTSKEYADIERTFKASLGRAGAQVTVVQINRIQIEDLYKQYATKKEKMIKSYSTTRIQVEHHAYHGTSEGSCATISQNGFNRSFNGVNGTALGKGTYFARDASYSNGYAKPSGPNNYKHMFYCKLLTGEYAIGNSTMIAPPAKPNNPIDLYDSVVDRHPNPAVFVIFNDTQAYPEYLIIYQ